ncbi:hypothetical protein MPER_10699 [Moniliophthora perniciosa FA553]|nr:hypothetical protein MPER_10699 [Moniliophthora perniciosa FA553]
MLPAFTCGQYGECNPYDGQCKCRPGWSGIDCLTPQCDSLTDGEQRRPREPGKSCECKEGWGGISCNVCKADDACVGFPMHGGVPEDGDLPVGNMTCYKGGETVFNNHQMCNVTNRKIIDQVGADKPVQVTFGCDSEDATCTFQFWVAEIESFYCALDGCSSEVKHGYDTNTTIYQCDELKCSCVPGRFICGENGSVDISDFLKEEIKGPAKFSCKTGAGWSFEEDAMNSLISDIFGDPYITLDCFGGESFYVVTMLGSGLLNRTTPYGWGDGLVTRAI